MACSAGARRNRRRPARHCARRGGDRRRERAPALRMRRGSPPTGNCRLVVVLPETVEQVSAVLRYCHGQGIRVVPRGAGTSLSGGALPLEDGVLLGLGKFNRILDIDYANRCAVVQPGVTNLAITQAVQQDGFYYAPDPSSQIACTIGGNVAENSGGVHCLKYGLTTNNVLGVQMALMGRHADPPRRQASRCGGLRPARPHRRLRRAARRRDRGHGAAAQDAGDHARPADRLPVQRRCRHDGRRDYRLGHRPGRHRDDGPARDPRRRGIRPCRLSARCRGRC